MDAIGLRTHVKLGIRQWFRGAGPVRRVETHHFYNSETELSGWEKPAVFIPS